MIVAELKPMITRSQAARILGISAERVNQLRRAGRIPAIETALGFLYQVADVESFQAEREARLTERNGG